MKKLLSVLLCAALLVGFAPLTFAEEAATYTVTYDANGGTGAPAEQVKIHGEPLTLSAEKPTREGYVFYCWCLKENEELRNKYYMPGDVCTIDEDLILTAVWWSAGTTVRSVSVPDEITIRSTWERSLIHTTDQEITVTIDADYNACFSVQYSSANEKVAKVVMYTDNIVGDRVFNQQIYLAGYRPGKTTLTVTVTDANGNTVTDTCKVRVRYTPFLFTRYVMWLLLQKLSESLDG